MAHATPMRSAFFTGILGVFVLVGGLRAYLSKGSVASLAGSATVATMLLVAALALLRAGTRENRGTLLRGRRADWMGHMIALVASAILVAIFAVRAAQGSDLRLAAPMVLLGGFSAYHHYQNTWP
jgi:uncharacterized membrane protein (UPF0136 family)